MRYLTGIAAAAMLMASTVTASHAQIMNDDNWCGEREDVVDIITDVYGVSPNGMGMVNDDLVIEHFVADNGIWVIIFTKGNGRSCIRAVGENWSSVHRPNVMKRDPALGLLLPVPGSTTKRSYGCHNAALHATQALKPHGSP